MTLLGVSCSTIARWARTGRLPATRPTHHRRYDVGGELESRAARAAREVRPAEPPEGWVTVPELVAELGIHGILLRRAIRAGQLDVRRFGRRRSLNESQVRAWVESHRVKPPA